ncbi:MAG: glycoside hydrolase family 9 protein [Planctomycetota bacterium]|nr:glycoside hydrolase family 9 protein [Planctomycetota bacterium]
MKTSNAILSSLVVMSASLMLPALGADAPAMVARDSAVRVWTDQIGYRTTGPKVLVVAGNAAIPSDMLFELCDAQTHQPVWSSKDHAGSVKPFKGGQKDGESGDFVAHLDLSDFTKPGRYYVAYTADGKKLRSFMFNIGDDVYREAGLAAMKSFYYQRTDCDKPEKYAGVWNHGPAFLGPNQAKEAKVYKWTGAPHYEPVGKEPLNDETFDVRGGWWDAGDFNKYTGNTVRCHNDLLLAYLLVAGAAKDNELNIPESGNKAPDMLDEIRYCTEFLMRVCDKEGAAFGKVHELGGCPPDAVKNPVQLTEVSGASTMARAAALAMAAVVWKESKFDDAFAKKCEEESRRSWDLLLKKPFPWKPDPKNPKKEAYSGYWFALEYDQMRALTAACYFRLTGESGYDQIVKEFWATVKPGQPGEMGDLYPLIWMYAFAPKADAGVADAMKKLILTQADQMVAWTGANKSYRMGIRGFWWGSNALIGRTGAMGVLAAELAADPAAKKKYLEAAEEYVHYLYGRNALGKCWLTNLKSIGAENSIMVMFHSWVGADGKPASAKYIGEGEGKVGPFPGMVVGGPNGGMKVYVEGLHWTKKPWEYNEPDITYQSPCVQLLAYFAYKGKDLK